MLAFMPQPSPLPDIHTPTSVGTGTMSLALLPSLPMTYGQQAVPTLPPPGPSPSKRPKLSLNTSSVAPVFGKGSTSLRLETLSATSPTARNTFQNGTKAERKSGGRMKRPGLTPLSTDVSITPTQTSTPSRIALPESADAADNSSSSSSTASATSISTLDSLSSEVPYKLPFNATSILSNGPIPRTKCRTMSFAQSKPMFPAAKKVAFRAQLTEDIETTVYTMRHSDILESPCSSNSTLEATPPKKGRRKYAGKGQEEANTEVEESSITSPQTGEKRESSDEEDDSDNPPQTPVAGRNKRSRKWVWTLGPISNASGEDKECATTTDATIKSP